MWLAASLLRPSCNRLGPIQKPPNKISAWRVTSALYYLIWHQLFKVTDVSKWRIRQLIVFLIFVFGETTVQEKRQLHYFSVNQPQLFISYHFTASWLINRGEGHCAIFQTNTTYLMNQWEASSTRGCHKKKKKKTESGVKQSETRGVFSGQV